MFNDCSKISTRTDQKVITESKEVKKLPDNSIAAKAAFTYALGEVDKKMDKASVKRAQKKGNLDVSSNLPLEGRVVLEKSEKFQNLVDLIGSESSFTSESNYGPFVSKDIVSRVKEHVLSLQDIQNFLSINTSFRKLAKPRDRVILTVTDLLNPQNEKLQYAHENKFKLKVNLSNIGEIKAMIDFVKTLGNDDVLNKIDALHFPDVTVITESQVNELLELIAIFCPNLTVLSCKDIYAGKKINMPPLKNLISFSCGNINLLASVSLTQLENLRTFSCGYIAGTILNLNENLRTFSCDFIGKKVTLNLNKNLETFSCGDIAKDVTINLNENLRTFSCKEILEGVTLKFEENLRFFSCDTIWGKMTLIFLKEPTKLKEIHYKQIYDTSVREVFEKLEAKAKEN